MKVPPKRKGNLLVRGLYAVLFTPSMKVPPKRKGNLIVRKVRETHHFPSMKVPPKRKGNRERIIQGLKLAPLNESPSEKEGKSTTRLVMGSRSVPQ